MLGLPKILKRYSEAELRKIVKQEIKEFLGGTMNSVDNKYLILIENQGLTNRKLDDIIQGLKNLIEGIKEAPDFSKLLDNPDFHRMVGIMRTEAMKGK